MADATTIIRYTRGVRCPICGGSDGDPRHQGTRCHGFTAGDWCHCSREEHAGGARHYPDSRTWAHKLRGPCPCGEEHAPADRPAPRKVDRVYVYRDADGRPHMEVVRFKDPKSFAQRLPKRPGERRYTYSVKGLELIPYRLDEIVDSRLDVPVWIVEGEKDADRLKLEAGLVATCNPGGAGKWRDAYSQRLNGRACYIVPDNDDAGRKHARAVARSLQKEAASIRIVELPGLPERGDVSDWLDAGGTIDALRELARSAPELLGADLGPAPAEEAPAAPAPSQGPATMELLMKIAEEVELWRTPTNEPYFSIPDDKGARKHVPAGSAELERWLRRRAWTRHRTSASAETLTACASILAMEAAEAGKVHRTWIRVADSTPPGTDDFMFHLDLGDDQRHAVRITAAGWEVVADPAGVKFLRPTGMGPLAMPERGGTLDDLWEFCNVEPKDRMLLVGTLTAMMRPFGPYPLLVLGGEQGCAKSTTARVLKKLVDPRRPILGSLPDTPLDLWVVASSNWLLSFDNISSINRTMSNALCQLALEGGLERRKLHTDMDVVIMEAMRPMILNGIDDFARQPDLVDRVVLLTCPVIDETARRLEREFWAKFAAKAPRILGALLDVMVGGLKALPSIRLDSMPRMAELATWGEAVGRHLGWEEGAFLGALFRNRDESSVLALEDSPVAPALFDLGRLSPEWKGSVKELLDDLRKTLGNGEHPGRGWPSNPRALSSHLRRIAPALRRAGVKVAFTGKTRRGQAVQVAWCAPDADDKHPDFASRPSHGPADDRDDGAQGFGKSYVPF